MIAKDPYGIVPLSFFLKKKYFSEKKSIRVRIT
jgi:hypothetical protein